ncbi:MAG: hypothetical protein M3019_05970 [Candidatus Dormibacteraeota bacterium]|nr:hypothetical protein [Candidatus Dormibacteraeota bacterium]
MTAAVVAVSSCGSPAPTPTPSARSTLTAATRPSAAAGPCASVATTTAIAQVPPACAALWAPYGVTKVPPANLTDSTPSAPTTVVNATQGGLSDAALKQWIAASNRDSLWYRWAEANDQASLMPRLGDVALDPPAELQAMAANEPITQPDCALFPAKLSVFVISPSDRRFFSSQPHTTSDQYVFVGTYPGPCMVTALNATGQTITIASYPSTGTTFFASHLAQDPLLGPLLFYDGAGNCNQTGAPSAWCRS